MQPSQFLYKLVKTYTEGFTEICGRAPCASSLWLREQRQAEISKQELLDQNADFDETLYVDGDWIKKGWKNKFETLIGREITEKMEEDAIQIRLRYRHKRKGNFGF